MARLKYSHSYCYIYGGAELRDRLLQLLQDVWPSEAVVKDCKDAVIVPIPKKGDLRECDNWRGISLLDVVGKVFGRVIQERLQVVVNEIFTTVSMWVSERERAH